MPRKLWQKWAVLALAIVGLFGGYLALSAPPDPVYKGQRFSAYLLSEFGEGLAKAKELPFASEAFQEKGIEAAPLLASWLEIERPLIVLRLQDWLRKLKVTTALLPSDRQAIALHAIRVVPALGAARALQSFLVTGHGFHIRQKAAVEFMFRFNSLSEEERRQIAAESEPFVINLLNYFERTGADEYPLIIIGALLETGAVPNIARFEARLRKDSEKARYLRRAVEALDRAAQPRPG